MSNVYKHINLVVEKISENEKHIVDSSKLPLTDLLQTHKEQIELGQLFQWLNAVKHSEEKKNKIIPMAKA